MSEDNKQVYLARSRTAGGSKVTLNDFSMIKVIGKGSYGKVMLVRDKKMNIYAMKMLGKQNVISRNQVEHTRTERSVLETVSHPFIVNLVYAFQTQKKLYFVLEYCPGGELFFHLARSERFSEPRCRFYACEILEALSYLHTLDIIYRDLKPENVLLDAEGHTKLTDFGLSKEGIRGANSARSMCGTPEYLAPEILDKLGHGKPVDWYSFGALMYEMLSGLPPFYTRDRKTLFARIRTQNLEVPPHVGPVAADLLTKLLRKVPHTRLGSGVRDGEEVKDHPFFAKVDWKAVVQKRIVPPFSPEITETTDVRYFDREFLDLPVINSEIQEEDVSMSGNGGNNDRGTQGNNDRPDINTWKDPFRKPGQLVEPASRFAPPYHPDVGYPKKKKPAAKRAEAEDENNDDMGRWSLFSGFSYAHADPDKFSPTDPAMNETTFSGEESSTTYNENSNRENCDYSSCGNDDHADQKSSMNTPVNATDGVTIVLKAPTTVSVQITNNVQHNVQHNSNVQHNTITNFFQNGVNGGYTNFFQNTGNYYNKGNMQDWNNNMQNFLPPHQHDNMVQQHHGAIVQQHGAMVQQHGDNSVQPQEQQNQEPCPLLEHEDFVHASMHQQQFQHIPFAGNVPHQNHDNQPQHPQQFQPNPQQFQPHHQHHQSHPQRQHQQQSQQQHHQNQNQRYQYPPSSPYRDESSK